MQQNKEAPVADPADKTKQSPAAHRIQVIAVIGGIGIFGLFMGLFLFVGTMALFNDGLWIASISFALAFCFLAPVIALGVIAFAPRAK